MYKRDYLQQQLEDFGKMLALLMGLRKRKEWRQFEEELKTAFKYFTAQELDILERESDHDFLTFLASDKLKPQVKKMLACLLFERLMQRLDTADVADAEQLKSRCLTTFNSVLNDGPGTEYDLDTHYKIEFLKKL